MKWNLPLIKPKEAEIFSKKFACNPQTAALLLGRNIFEPSEIQYFLSSDLRALHNPFLLSQMPRAVGRLQGAISEGERVLVFGDRDVDGITSLVLLVSELRNEGLEVFWEVPMGDAPYALTTEVIQSYAKQDVTLCITVDCGISNVREIDIAQELGVDCIVIDHHIPSSELPNAHAIINPKCDFENYPFEELSAVALVAKLLTALDFSQSDFYDQEVCFLNLRPGNNSIIVEAVKMKNMLEVSRISETVVKGHEGSMVNSIISYIQDQAILMYQQEHQLSMIRKIFGEGVHLEFIDISTNVWKEFPKLKGRTLLSMSQASRANKYSSTALSEIDAAIHLLNSFFYAKNPNILHKLNTRVDLVALGIIADMMPMKNENRILAAKGLEMLSQTERSSLKELYSRLAIRSSSLRSVDLAMKICPAINATGRMGRPDHAIKLLLEEGNIAELADSVHRLNEDRKILGKEAWNKAIPVARESMEDLSNVLSLVRHSSIHRGITGLLASRISKELRVPSIVIADIQSAAGTDSTITGSLRSIRGLHVTDFLSQFSEFFEAFGGHSTAGGFRMKKSQFEEFYIVLKEKSQYIELIDWKEDEIQVDIYLEHSEFTENLEHFQASLEPFGQEFPPIYYMVENVRIENVHIIGRHADHLRMLVSTKERKWPAIYWGAADRYEKDFRINSVIDCVFTLERNFFNSMDNLQMNIVDIRITQ